MSRLYTTCVLWAIIIGSSSTAWAVPEIFAKVNGATALENIDYFLTTTEPDQNLPGSTSFHNVRLFREGSWEIWSRDDVNTTQVSDIGIVSCPEPKDFDVSFVEPGTSNLGVREVKGIDLIPSNASNYSRISDGTITTIAGDLKVQAEDTAPIDGGSVNLVVQDVTGNIDIGTIKVGHTLHVTGAVDGTTKIAGIEGVSKSSYGKVWIKEHKKQLLIDGDVNGHLEVEIVNDDPAVNTQDLLVKGDCGVNSLIKIHDIVDVQGLGYTIVHIGEWLGATTHFLGRFEVHQDLDSGRIHINSLFGDDCSTPPCTKAVADFMGNDLYTFFGLMNGGGTNSVTVRPTTHRNCGSQRSFFY